MATSKLDDPLEKLLAEAVAEQPGITPCALDPQWKIMVREYAVALQAAGSTIGEHGMTEEQFRDSGLFDSAIERLRGQKSASTKIKRQFIDDVLTALKGTYISQWSFEGAGERHDYIVKLKNGRTIVVEAKGCLDGNNTNIFERPKGADEFYIWSLCQNIGSDLRHNVWSGIHSRLSAEIINRGQLVDGLIVWDMLCGNTRKCPKLMKDGTRATVLKTRHGDVSVPPPCLYLFPRNVPTWKGKANRKPPVHTADELQFISLLAKAFKTRADEITHVSMEVRISAKDDSIQRQTICTRDGKIVAESRWDAIKRAS